MITFLYPWVIFYGVPFVIVSMLLSERYRKQLRYRFPLTHMFRTSSAFQQAQRTSWCTIVRLLRWLIPILIIFIIARPQYPDVRSRMRVEGVATMLVLDVSGSMQSFDDINDRKPRFQIAQEEAIKFIQRRDNDLCGLVIFGAVAASRCPLTADKKIISDIIRDTKIGVLNHDGTMLSMAIALGVNRLRTCTCQSKVMVVLTDGAPSDGDLNPREAVDLAKKAGVKIYTIGIGSPEGGMVEHPFGVMRIQTPLNDNLLRAIAGETGGMYFHAADQHDLARIYAHIDMLEKSPHETPVYSRYYELYIPLLMLVLCLLALELIITAYVWVVLS